jgi:hypothetical protein
MQAARTTMGDSRKVDRARHFTAQLISVATSLPVETAAADRTVKVF